MARPALVIDASIGVKWFSGKDESTLRQALAIRDSHISESKLIIVPDLFYYEVTNALIHKKFIPTDLILAATSALFALELNTVLIDAGMLESSVNIARKLNITIYDSCYIALARRNNCPLITANPRHQVQVPGCRVIPLEEWQ